MPDPLTQYPLRVHLRALVRLQHLHVAISSGRCPSIQDLAESSDRNSRTVKRDLKMLREDFRAPLLYDRQCKGFRYTEPGWQLPPVRFSEGELLAFFTAHHVLQALGQNPEATLLRDALAKLAAFLPEHVVFNPNTISTALTFQAMPHAMAEPQTLRTLTRAAVELMWLYSSGHTDTRAMPNLERCVR
jgi:predicted DNA-binding transcriptional regulator YafY